VQAQQDAEAAAEAAVAAKQSAAKLDPGQLQRLKERNHELMQCKSEAAAAKQREEEERVARVAALQQQVGCVCS